MSKTKKGPLVSIVIPVYNGSNYVKEAINSSLNQTYKNIEVIVVNDGSTDNTEEILKSYGDKIRYFSKENGGVATALNLAIEKANGEYISWLSHDDVYYPNKIEKQIKVLDKLENKDTILYSDFAFIDKKSKIKSYFYIKTNHPLYKLNMPLYPILNGLIHGCTLLIPKKCFYEVGFFDTNLKTTQDYDLWYKMFPKYKIKYMPEFLVKSRTHDEQGSKSIPSAKTEADDLWIKMLSGLTKKDRYIFEGSEYAFYKKVYELMKGANYNSAAKWVKDKLDNIVDKMKYSKDIKVSVIIPFFNRVELLKNAIESVLAQSHQNFELILVDDYSNKDISEIKEYIKKDLRIKLCKNKFKKGASGARNTGITEATGDYIAFLDSDDLFLPKKLEMQLKFMVENDYKATNTYYQVNDKGEFYVPEYIKLDKVVYPFIISGCSIATPTVMLNKDIINEFDFKFNENYSYGEDICLWIDIAKYFTIQTLQEVLTTVNRDGKNTVNSPHKLFNGVANIFSHSANEETMELYPEHLYILQHYYLDEPLEKIFKKRRSIFSKNKLTRLFYRIIIRPILKAKYQKEVVRAKFDKKFLN